MPTLLELARAARTAILGSNPAVDGDCEAVSDKLCDLLNDAGYDARIVTGFYGDRKLGLGHIWVQVEDTYIDATLDQFQQPAIRIGKISDKEFKQDHTVSRVFSTKEAGYSQPKISASELPPAPGTAPIPANTVRLYHYTKSYDNLPSILQNGLLKSQGRGDGGSYNEPSAGVWASTVAPSNQKLYVEFWATYDQISHNADYPDKGEDLTAWSSTLQHVIMRGDVPPSQFVAVHEPWHFPAYHLLKDWEGTVAKSPYLADPAYAEELMSSRYEEAAGKALDYIQKLKGIRKTASSPFATNATQFIEAAGTISLEEVKAGKLPGMVYAPERLGTMTVASYRNDHILVNTSFFDDDAFGRAVLLWHEFGHEVAQRAFADNNAAVVEVIRPFRKSPEDGWSYNNPCGISSRPEEMIADVYSELMMAKSKPWEDEEWRCVPLYKFVLDTAKKLGMPIPSWYSGSAKTALYEDEKAYATHSEIKPGWSSYGEGERLSTLPDDTLLWVYHATDKATAQRFLTEGINPETKPNNLARMRYEQGGDEYAEFAPGRGLAGGLYVGLTPMGVEGYGREVLAIHCRKGDLKIPPEQEWLGRPNGVHALVCDDAYIDKPIPASDIRLVKRASKTADLRKTYRLPSRPTLPRDKAIKWIWSEATGPVLFRWKDKSENGMNTMHAKAMEDLGLPCYGWDFDKSERGTAELNAPTKSIRFTSYNGGEDTDAVVRMIRKLYKLPDDWKVEYDCMHLNEPGPQSRPVWASLETWEAAGEDPVDAVSYIQDVIITAEIPGFGGLCGIAAIALNHALFNDRATYVVVYNRPMFQRAHRFLGHVALKYNDHYWDADGEVLLEDVQSHGMLDPQDSDYIGYFADYGEWDEDKAYDIVTRDSSEEEVRQLFSFEMGKVPEFESKVKAAIAHIDHEDSKLASKTAAKKYGPLYHGSRSWRDTVKNDKYTVGMFFSSSPDVAKCYGPKVFKAYVTINKPFIVDCEENSYGRIPTPKQMQKWTHLENVDADNIADWAHQNGYDGAILRNVLEGNGGGIADDYIVFDISQATPIAEALVSREYWGGAIFPVIGEWVKTASDDEPKSFRDWLGKTKTMGQWNARDLSVTDFKNDEGVQPEPFMGKYTIRKGYAKYQKGFSGKGEEVKDGFYTVFDGEKPVASFCQGALVVDKKYRGQGIGLELAKTFMRDYPNYRPSSVTSKSKKLFEKAWNELHASSKTASTLTFSHECVGAHSGQSDMVLRAEVNGKVVGYIQYCIYQDEPHVQMIEVLSENLRKGYGSALVKELQKEFPGVEIDFGGTTPDGTALLDSLQWSEEPTEHAAPLQELKELKEEEARFQAIADKYDAIENPTEVETAQFRKDMELCDEVNDRIWELEQELHDKRPTKRLVAGKAKRASVFYIEVPESARGQFWGDKDV